jgi:hypothetical protein
MNLEHHADEYAIPDGGERLLLVKWCGSGDPTTGTRGQSLRQE